jgi:hypothetical protein
MQSTLQRPAETVFKTAAPATPKTTIVYWISTALFCLLMTFTAYAELRLPQVADAFTHLGFPAYFRVELSWAKLIGVVLMLARVPARLSGNNAAWTRTACALKEWVYAGFAFDLASRRSPILSVGDGPAAWGWAAATSVLWMLSYFSWRRLHAKPSGAPGIIGRLGYARHST